MVTVSACICDWSITEMKFPTHLQHHPSEDATAALVSTKVSSVLRQELDYKNVKEVFWTDSQVVLGYKRNDAKSFHVFVANRIQQIRDSSSPSQCQYVRTEENPADEAPRGVSPRNLVNNSNFKDEET